MSTVTATFPVEEITPELASEFLEKHPTGLRINQRDVKTCKGLIRAGRWKVSHQGVVFTKDGQLIVGAEMLTAIIETGITVPLKVTRNEDPSRLGLYGRGRRRDSRDILRTVCRVKLPGPEVPLVNAMIVHALRGSTHNPLHVQASHAAFDEAIKEVIAIKHPSPPPCFWRTPQKAAVCLALAGNGYKERTREFVSELFDRRDATHRVRVFRRAMNEGFGHASPSELIAQSLIALAAYTEMPVKSDAEEIRRFLLTNAGIEELPHE